MFSFLWNGILVALGLSSHGSEVAAQGLAQGLPRRVNYFDLPLEISDKVMMHGSPLDLVAFGQTCKTMRSRSQNPRVRKATLENVGNPPMPPAHLDPTPTFEAWVLYLLTGLAKKDFRGFGPTFHQNLNLWFATYKANWSEAGDKNMAVFSDFATERICERRGVIRPNKKDLTERIRLFMRTPAFNAMFEVFRRDLEVMDRRTLQRNMDLIMEQADLIAMGDLDAFPAGYRPNKSDVVVCPMCPTVGPETWFRYQLRGGIRAHTLRPWRIRTRIEIKALGKHYETAHPGHAPPHIPDLEVGCPYCPRKSQVYDALALQLHTRTMHGVVNPPV
ncbi:hypothetical protein EV714DRAFT_271283 [Schizophyllum commune]